MNILTAEAEQAAPGSAFHISETKALIKNLTAHCQAYKGADTKRSAVQLVTTLVPFLALYGWMLLEASAGAWAVPLLLAPLAAGLLVRLFIIQHDCGHGSYFRTRRANDLVGRFLSLLTWTPYSYWMRAHNMHHAGSGNLDRRSLGSIDTLTVAEYRALPRRNRLQYRLYRNPFILLVLGTPLHILFIQRFPPGQKNPFLADYKPLPLRRTLRSIMGLNAALFAFYGALAFLFGWQAVLLTVLPVVVITAWVGGWLFYMQHQFEETYWAKEGDWSFHEAAVLGSSYYDLPPVLHWFTGNIGLHHIHHLCSAIPNYRLQECLKASEALRGMNRVTLRESLKCLKWALWDEAQQKMVGFRDLKAC